MRDARNVRDGDEATFETTAEQELMQEFGLTPEQYEAAIAEFENLDVISLVNATGALPPDETIIDNIPCTVTFEEYQEWHTSVGAISDANIDYQLYVVLCEAKGDNWIPTTQPVQQEESNNTLLKTGLLLGGAYLVFNAFNKK